MSDDGVPKFVVRGLEAMDWLAEGLKRLEGVAPGVFRHSELGVEGGDLVLKVAWRPPKDEDEEAEVAERHQAKYPPEVRKALGDMADNAKRHKNRANHARQQRDEWKRRALAAEAVMAQLKPFWDQCVRGESENPERYADAYRMLDRALRQYMEENG